MIKVLIVDDSNFMLNVIKNTLKSYKDIDVIGQARDGIQALDQVEKLNPDVITMDLVMPKMNGVEAIEKIIKENPLPIIILSSQKRNSVLTIQALQKGAYDFIHKPGGEVSTDIASIKEDLADKIRSAYKSNIKKVIKRKVRLPEVKNKENIELIEKRTAKFIIAIGVSTGGPRLLREILGLFHENINAAVIISQHIPEDYSATLAEQINKATNLHVLEAETGMDILEGCVYIAPGHMNLLIKEKKILLEKPSAEVIYIPSVDAMFKSAALEYKDKCIGVVLTGLGNDGSKGIKYIKENQGFVITQEESTCVVSGMVKAAVKTGFVDITLTPRMIPRKIEGIIKNKLMNI